MIQKIQGVELYVLDFTEKEPADVYPVHGEGNRVLEMYAEATNQAIERGLIKRGNKYGIEIEESDLRTDWKIHLIKE